MIHEYALEPELVATWGNRKDYRYFIEKFGLGQPRIASRYPKKWKRLVFEAFHGTDDIEKKRLEELVQRLAERMVHRRDALWDPGRTWSDNARAEHGRIPFHAIIARENPDGNGRVLLGTELDDTTPLWAVPLGVTIARRATEMAAAVAAMLRIAGIIVFVDPYFGPDSLRHRRTLEAFLGAVIQSRPIDGPGRVEVHTSIENTETWKNFEVECRRRLPRCIPAGVTLRIVRLEERELGDDEDLHNRYILTDVGGVSFVAGLDEGDGGATDDLHVLSRAQYDKRWQQYASAAPAFDRPEPPIDVQAG